MVEQVLVDPSWELETCSFYRKFVTILDAPQVTGH